MARLISRQRGGLAALKLTKSFGINDFPVAKDSGKVLIIIMYCYLIIIIIIAHMINHFEIIWYVRSQLSTKVRPDYKYKTDRMDLDADKYKGGADDIHKWLVNIKRSHILLSRSLFFRWNQ